MEIEISLQKGARHALSGLYASLRKLKQKRKGIVEAMQKTREEISKEREKSKKIKKAGLEDTNSQMGGKSAKSKKGNYFAAKGAKRKGKSWSNAFHSFYTSGGFLAVAGKNAKQNDELYANHLEENDLFFHADIQGAPALILKDGKDAGVSDLREAAQWAASYSSAWKVGAASVDVYAVEKQQISKHATGGHVGRGAFVLAGERKWFKAIPLCLKIGKLHDNLLILPQMHSQNLQKQAILSPGGEEKQQAAKKLSAHLSAKADLIAQLLPTGKFNIQL
ncbi:hypothetical protein COU37_05205 [Candidatus Micrarchaeota archaeon CG10_big_fil_rev_8_21_14_0_10_45_29]|nr:MAG: hypothetical protein COU37_05205 [Candidatus Micrarchaeota archaeon CG10_big_fil_rev_8_21_14_0_10_45_29]